MAKKSASNQMRDDSIRKEIREIFDMFDVLERCYDELPDKIGITESFVRFDGFDAQRKPDEDYYRVGLEMTTGSRGRQVFASHMPRVQGYLGMVSRWKTSKNQNKLTKEDIIRITTFH
jgi:uncharacterized protein YfbU (UPF0304 family)